MGIFNKSNKKSPYDCSDRPTSWFSDGEGAEARSLLLLKNLERVVNNYNYLYSSNSASEAYGTMINNIVKSENLDVKEMVKSAKKLAPTTSEGWNCVWNSAHYFYIHFFKSLKLQLPKYSGYDSVEYEGAKLLIYDCIHLIIESIDFSIRNSKISYTYETKGRPPLFGGCNPVKIDVNPLLKFLVRLNECDGEFAKEYGSFTGYDDWKVIQAESLKTKLYLLRYIDKVAAEEDVDVSENSWLYDGDLYFSIDKHNHVKPVSFEQACDKIGDMVDYPNFWTEILAEDSGMLEYIEKCRPGWEIEADKAKKAQDFKTLDDAINAMGQKKE